MSGGKIHLIGLGPGDRALLTPAAVDALERCDVVVGYDGYVEQVRDLVEGKQVVSMPLGKEMERACQSLLNLQATGKTVAVISSGDIGVYGMAGPVFEHLAAKGWDGEHPQVEVVPAVSAAQAAASVLGAPLMQDFCAISLSDLMTPWETIRKTAGRCCVWRLRDCAVQPAKHATAQADCGGAQTSFWGIEALRLQWALRAMHADLMSIPS